MASDSSQTTHQPGTLFRIYSADKSKHYTAVLLKNGKFLEVKGDGEGRIVYENLDEFRTARSSTDSTMEITDKYTDRSKKKILKLKETKQKKKVIKFSSKKSKNMMWLRWCYLIMKEGMPELLVREDVVNAFYSLVDVIEKYDNELESNSLYTFKGNFIYSIDHISEQGEWKGLPLRLKIEAFTYSFGGELSPEKKILKEKCKTIREEIIKVYDELINLIKEDMQKYLTKKTNIKKLDTQIKFYLKMRDSILRRLKQYQYYVSINTNKMNEYNDKIDKLNRERETI